MRVVGGALGGRRLVAPEPGSDSTRPTSDRAREAIFNMLVSVMDLDGVTVTDLFAGTGALGIEALSRGAAHAAFIDSDPAACRIINANLAGLGLAGRAAVVRSDIESYLAAYSDTVDLAFADPPYGFDRWAELLRTLDAAVLVCESDREIEPGPDHPWDTWRVRQYGTPVITILLRPDTIATASHRDPAAQGD